MHLAMRGMSVARLHVANANRQVPKLGPALFHQAGFEQPSLQSAGHPWQRLRLTFPLAYFVQSALVRLEYELPFSTFVCSLTIHNIFNSIP